MSWHKVVEYRTYMSVDDTDYAVMALKEGNDEEFAVHINGEYIADCAELPTQEYIEQLIGEEEEIAERIGRDSFRLA